MPIYTKKGDQGQTIVFSKKKKFNLVSKSSPLISTIGAIDELNSYLGIIVATSEDEKIKESLNYLQEDLLRIGSIIGGSDLRFFSSKIKKLEKTIDKLDKSLAPLQKFIIPGGSAESSQLHFARTLVRKVEREMVKLNKSHPVKSQIIVFLNRLSDYLFVLARYVNNKNNIKDRVWVSRKK